MKNRIILFAVSVMLPLLMMPAFAASAREVSDTDITSAVNTELWADNAVSANNIDVDTDEGVVTLEGKVNSILAKDRAEAIAEAVVGVRSIVNLVKVKPDEKMSDRKLAKEIERAWIEDPAADSFELDAEVDDGIVTITGKVQSFAEKNLSAMVAKGVKGVKGIKNEIEVRYKTERNDTEIENEITERLKNDVRVDDYLIDVEVDDGEVELSGTVGSLQEKSRARSDAWVAGVESVEAEDLDVDWWARDKMRRTKTYISRTDAEIKKAVQDAFLYDPRVLSFKPSVKVTAGTVTLSGSVDNLAAKRAAEEDAQNTIGVWRVKNQIKVRPDVPSNEELENRVQTALLRDPYVERYQINVDAYNGWVYLSGEVNTSYEKNKAERVTEKVKGVAGVINSIDYEYEWIWKPDWEIRADVQDQLAWSPFVDAEDVSVSVDDGLVTLSGTVDSWSESDDAEKNAYQGGAKDVLNNLTVDYSYYGPYGPGYYGSDYYRGG